MSKTLTCVQNYLAADKQLSLAHSYVVYATYCVDTRLGCIQLQDFYKTIESDLSLTL